MPKRTSIMTICVNKTFSQNCGAQRKNAPSFAAWNINSRKVISSLKWINDNFASHHQRLILGATALSLQPFIDLNNKKVDEQTRKVSCAKTIAKIIVGTTTGFFVRWGCTTLAKNFTTVDNAGKQAAKKSFLAPSVMKNFSTDKRLQYINAVGAILGVLTCLVTNFLLDAPMTKYFTNMFIDKINTKQAQGGKK